MPPREDKSEGMKPGRRKIPREGDRVIDAYKRKATVIKRQGDYCYLNYDEPVPEPYYIKYIGGDWEPYNLVGHIAYLKILWEEM